MSNINIFQTSTEDFKIGTLMNVEAVNDSLVLKSSLVTKNIVGENRRKIPLIANFAKGKGGITFTVKNDIVISSLGFYNTWDSSHTSIISLVDSTSKVIASTIAYAPSEMSAFSDIEPLTLIAGETYRLECTHNRRTSFITQAEYTSYINFDSENFNLVSHESNLSGYVTALPFMRVRSIEFPIFGYRQFAVDINELNNAGNSVVSWDETILNNTRIIVEASCDYGKTWKQLINGGTLPSISEDLTSILIRQNLITSDINSSPSLNEFSLFIDEKEFAFYETDLIISEKRVNKVNRVFNSESSINVVNINHTDRRFKVYNHSMIEINSLNNNYFKKDVQSNSDIVVDDSNLTDIEGIEIEINYIETLDKDFDEGTTLVNVRTKDDTLELSKEDYYLPNVLKTHQTISSIKPVPGTRSGLTITDTGWEFKALDDIYIKNLKWLNTHDIKLNALITIWDVELKEIIIQQEVSAHNGWGIVDLEEPLLLTGSKKYIISVRKNLGEPYLMIPLNDVKFVPFSNVVFTGGKNISASNNSSLATYPVENVNSINRFPSFDFYLASNKIANGYALRGYRISKKIDLSKIEYIVASEISWNSVGNIKIETSVDEGLTWQKAVNGKPVENLIGYGKGRFLLIRETLTTVSRKETPYLYDLTVNISDKPYPQYNLFENSIIDIESISSNYTSIFDDKNEDLVVNSESEIVIHRFVISSDELIISSEGIIKVPLLQSKSKIEVNVDSNNFFNKHFISESEIIVDTRNNSPKTVSIFNKSLLSISSDQKVVVGKFVEAKDSIDLQTKTRTFIPVKAYGKSELLVNTSSTNHSKKNIEDHNELSFNEQISIEVKKKAHYINNIIVDSKADSNKNLHCQDASSILVNSSSRNFVSKIVRSISKVDLLSESNTVKKLNLSSSSKISVSDLNKVARIKLSENNSSITVETISSNITKRNVTSANQFIVNNANSISVDKFTKENSSISLNVLSNNSFNKLLSAKSKIEGINSLIKFNSDFVREDNSNLIINSSTYQPKIKKLFEKQSIKLNSTVLVDNGYSIDISGTRTLTLPKNIPSGIEFKVGEKSLQVDAVKIFANASGREYPAIIWDVDTKESIWIQMVRSTVSDGWTKVPLENPVVLKPNKNYVLSTIAYEGLTEREIKPLNITPNSELLKIVQYRQGDPEYVDYFPETYAGQNVEIYAAVDIDYSRVVYDSPKVETDVISLNEMHTILDSKIEWSENVPLGTAILVETSIDDGGTWQKVSNGGVIIPSTTVVSGKELLIRQTLTSSKEELTPTLSNLKINLQN